MADERENLSITAAAVYLGVHPDTLRDWADQGKVKCWLTPGRQRRFTRTDLDALKRAS